MCGIEKISDIESNNNENFKSIIVWKCSDSIEKFKLKNSICIAHYTINTISHGFSIWTAGKNQMNTHAKRREIEQRKMFGNKIHLNLWMKTSGC